jgi:DNA-binding response OmpR family regulator
MTPELDTSAVAPVVGPGGTARTSDTFADRFRLVVVGDDALTGWCVAGPLNVLYEVEAVTTVEAATRAVSSLRDGLVLTEFDLPDGDGVDVCLAAKQASPAVVVLVSISDATRVPRVLNAGCDSVLLKPFAPNLLYARLGRLTRDLGARRASPLRGGAAGGTNQQWPAVACPTCGVAGAVSFDATSLRRAWYACLACEHVWIGRRQQ